MEFIEAFFLSRLEEQINKRWDIQKWREEYFDIQMYEMWKNNVVGFGHRIRSDGLETV